MEATILQSFRVGLEEHGHYSGRQRSVTEMHQISEELCRAMTNEKTRVLQDDQVEKLEEKQ